MIQVQAEGYTKRRERFSGPRQRLDYFLVAKKTKHNYDLIYQLSNDPKIGLDNIDFLGKRN